MSAARVYPRFLLNSEQCEILLVFDRCNSVTALAEELRKDVSVISRQLKGISETAPVLEKIQGRWHLTPLGKELSRWTQESIADQQRILRHKKTLRIGATREFAARVLAPRLSSLPFVPDKKTELIIITHEEGVAPLLLQDLVDFGFDCGRPDDPLIKFKLVKTENFSVVAAPGFKGLGSGVDTLGQFPFLAYSRVSAGALLGIDEGDLQVKGRFNDVATVREACIGGEGWSVLPRYAVDRELKSGALKEIGIRSKNDEKFGVWWLRSRSSFTPIVEGAIKWLSQQVL